MTIKAKEKLSTILLINKINESSNDVKIEAIFTKKALTKKYKGISGKPNQPVSKTLRTCNG